MDKFFDKGASVPHDFTFATFRSVGGRKDYRREINEIGIPFSILYAWQVLYLTAKRL